MKTLHGKRHIRARKSVAVGRLNRQRRKFNGMIAALKNMNRIIKKTEWNFQEK